MEEILGVPQQMAETYRMTVEGKAGWLSSRQIVRLAAAVSMTNMITIAEGYLNLSEEIIAVLLMENRSHPAKFNREVLRRWANRNTSSDQVMV